MKFLTLKLGFLLIGANVVFGNSPAQGGSLALQNAAPLASQVPLKSRAPFYQLRKGDSFLVDFTFSPEFNQTVTVQPDGYIALKGTRQILAEGLTIPNLASAIQLQYAGVLHDPVVTIELKDFEKPYFIAGGLLGKPGKYDLRSDLTLTQGVAIAGGFTEASKHSQVVLYRPGPDGVATARVFNVKKMLRTHDLTEDVHLLPGDMIYVPQNGISKIAKYLPTPSLGLYVNPLLR